MYWFMTVFFLKGLWTFFVIMVGHTVIHLARDYIKEKKTQQIARATSDVNSCM